MRRVCRGVSTLALSSFDRSRQGRAEVRHGRGDLVQAPARDVSSDGKVRGERFDGSGGRVGDWDERVERARVLSVVGCEIHVDGKRFLTSWPPPCPQPPPPPRRLPPPSPTSSDLVRRCRASASCRRSRPRRTPPRRGAARPTTDAAWSPCRRSMLLFLLRRGLALGAGVRRPSRPFASIAPPRREPMNSPCEPRGSIRDSKRSSARVFWRATACASLGG